MSRPQEQPTRRTQVSESLDILRTNTRTVEEQFAELTIRLVRVLRTQLVESERECASIKPENKVELAADIDHISFRLKQVAEDLAMLTNLLEV